ncbi:brain and acute leukemia cytoplasmic protein [Protobothrops mucrosquamatus]|uniref:brain and acute leukemia cytoplasmic protein n=1 Tax=Protobothrops mucrosquamatus TaxID=103944 RepID=UPI0010FB2748|nr:brain and acute leukemia cytoplasmic protein [Protobothrops mucrosquamatus]
MGCGGSRADAIEPRYYESWTRETESTWLTNTDAEPQQQPLPAAGPESGDAEAGLKGPGILEDSKSTQTCMAKSSISSGVAIPEKRTHCATQCAKLSTHTTGNAAQKPQNSFKASEVKWDKKRTTKEVSSNTSKTDKYKQINSNRRVAKNGIN